MGATATPDGIPSTCIALCKTIEPDPPAVVFCTSYRSQEGRELDANPRAAGRADLSGRIERWSSRSGRLHDRVQWARSSEGAWSVTRLGS